MVLRRGFLAAAAAAVAAAGCGFRLRQAPNFAFASIYIASTSALANELRRSIASGGKVTVITDAAQAPQADVSIELLVDQREKAVVGLNATGQVREFQLRTRVRFRLRGRAGRELIPETELVLTRDISFSESAVLSKEAEEGLLYRDMQTDIVQQMLRRLAAVKDI